MEQENVLSLLIGTASSEAAAEEAVTPRYDEEGESIRPWFELAFNTGWLDTDFLELKYMHPTPTDAAALLDGVSYGEHLLRLVPREALAERQGSNLLVLLLNFDYRGGIPFAKNDHLELHFLGSFPFEP